MIWLRSTLDTLDLGIKMVSFSTSSGSKWLSRSAGTSRRFLAAKSSTAMNSLLDHPRLHSLLEPYHPRLVTLASRSLHIQREILLAEFRVMSNLLARTAPKKNR